MSKSHSIIRSFPYAIRGIKDTILKEPNFKIEVILGILAIILGVVFSLPTTEWLILSISIFLVLIMELINTTLENLVDIVSRDSGKSQSSKGRSGGRSSHVLDSIRNYRSLYLLPKILKLF